MKRQKFYQAPMLLKIFSALYLAALAYLVFFARRRHNIHVRSVSFVPFTTLWKDYDNISSGRGFKYFTDLLGNILLLTPLPFILIMLFKMSRPTVIVFVCFTVSVFIEILQYVFMVGYADIDDVLLNTLGAWLGLLFFSKLISSGLSRRMDMHSGHQ